jgi:hypothetical protein
MSLHSNLIFDHYPWPLWCGPGGASSTPQRKNFQEWREAYV